MEVLKVVVQMSPNHLLLREKVGVMSSFPVVCRCATVGVYGEIVSQLLLISMLFFSHSDVELLLS